MKLKLTCLLLLACNCLFAQQSAVVIKRDTVNIHGFIYDNDGKPMKRFHIQSAQLETEHNYFKAGAYTDETGYFNLKGAKFNDTLIVGPDIRFTTPAYYNRGSRYMVIYMPPAKVTNVSAEPIEITQKRRSVKTTPSFTIQAFSDAGNITEVSAPAEYPGGMDQLITFLKKNVIYPEKAIRNGAEGTVEIEFTITVDGKVSNVKTLKDIDFDTADEVIHVLKKAEKWKPAIDHSHPVPVLERLTVLFKLTD